MKREMKDVSQKGSGVSISLPIPATDLFKHKATDDVLLFLSRHSFEEYTISEIATYTGHTEPSVKRSVDVLSENGLVKDTPEGNRRLVEINRDRLSIPDDPHLQIPQTEFQKPTKAAAEEIEDRLENVQAIILYGSVARGEADRRSDIDLWILVSKDRPEEQRKANEIRKELEEKEFDGDRYGFDIDVESVSSVPKYTKAIRKIVLSGITLYKKEDFAPVRNLIEGCQTGK
jgi:predicted nucleotidyltransferase